MKIKEKKQLTCRLKKNNKNKKMSIAIEKNKLTAVIKRLM